MAVFSIHAFGILRQPTPPARIVLLAAIFRAASLFMFHNPASAFRKYRTRKGILLRKLALLASACTLLLFAGFAAAQAPAQASVQKVDIMLGGSTLEAFSANNDSVNFRQPQEKGGTYYSVSGDYVGFKKRRLGINVETAWRSKQTSYPFNGESYRPFFTDVNALYQPRIGKKFGLDVMAGVGIATTRFNLPPVSSCSTAAGGCINYTNSNHFMEHLGFGVRYYFFRSFFARPEVHYYHIQNNVQFYSPNVFRVGASIGYTFGTR